MNCFYNLSDQSPKLSETARPTICRNCGSIIGGGESQCAVCGAAVGSSDSSGKSRQVIDGETMRFARAILDRPHKFTIVMLMVNIFVFLLMWNSSGMTSESLWAFPDTVLLAYGAKLNSLINEQRQWWRFVTPVFVHVNLPHLLVNMYSLWMVGPYVEKLYGSARFVVFWVGTGIAGVIASYLTVRPDAAVGMIGRFLFKTADVPSAGASGAIFGLVGVLFVFGIKFRHELPEGFKKAFGTGMLPVIFINLFIGYLGSGFIDNAAHLGGLAAGAVLALAVNYRRPGERSAIATVWQGLQAVSLGLVALSFLMAYKNSPSPSLPLLQQKVRNDNEQARRFVTYVKAIADGGDAFYAAIKDGDATTMDQAFKNLDAAPQLDPKSDELKERLKVLMGEAKTLTEPGDRSSKIYQEKQNSITKEFVAWNKEYNSWLKTTGRNYSGLVEIKETP